MQKNERQAHIRQLIQSEVIERQSDFVTRLKALGVPVTQATISRDIKEMQLIKVPDAAGHYRYALPPAKQLQPADKLCRTLIAAYQSGQQMAQFVNVKTNPGTAPAIGNLIDQLNDDRVFATVAGDASILIICRDAEGAAGVLATLEGMVG